MVKFFCKLLGVKSKRDFFLLLSLWKNPIFVVKMLRRSQSQNSQDVFVAHQLKLWDSPRESYYFVEFGAADGIYLSNTFLLESAFNWKGLLVEPGRVWRESLLANRTCAKDFRCVYSESGRSITFSETEEPVLLAKQKNLVYQPLVHLLTQIAMVEAVRRQLIIQSKQLHFLIYLVSINVQKLSIIYQ